MNNVDKQYLSLLQDILDNGVYKETRAGAVKSVFGRTMRFNLKEGLPLLITKKVFTKGIIHELLWFLSGSTNIKYLVDNNVHIWTDDAYRYYLELSKYNGKPLSKEEFIDKVKEGCTYYLKTQKEGILKYYKAGDLGDVYGKQWRKFGVTNRDQIQDIIDKLKNTPDDRRMILTSWNPDVLDNIALPACHAMYQFYSRELSNVERLEWLCQHSNGEYDEWKSPTKETLDELNVPKRALSCSFLCRSQDVMLGTPFNICSASLLTHMIAQCCDMVVDELVYFGNDIHIYMNQIDGVKEQLKRDPIKYDLPQLVLNPNIKNINDFKYEDINIIGYQSYPQIKVPLNVGL